MVIVLRILLVGMVMRVILGTVIVRVNQWALRS
jgi:hypothetical protein